MEAMDKAYEAVLHELQKNTYTDGISASELAVLISVGRSTASLYLSSLAEKGRLVKGLTRPVRYSLPEYEKSAQIPSISALDSVIGASQSLMFAIELCKTAAIYPPDGMPVLILGNSGTGKSYLARKLYEYAAQLRCIPAAAKYVEFNCADYASNPQLLSSTLFGHVKGAFTGASETRAGLVTQADGGYMFLDEVHRLSFENQEKLFLLMDQGRYRMLGENKGWHTAKIRFIFATTESPDQVLLKTLLRRIPIQFSLPDWSERSIWERLQIIQKAFQAESKLLGRDIHVPANSVNYLLQHQSDGNIGSIRNIIRISCAQLYKESAKTGDLVITLPRQSKNPGERVMHKLSKYVPALHIDQREKAENQSGIVLPFEAELRSLVKQIGDVSFAAVRSSARRILRHLRTAASDCFPMYTTQNNNSKQNDFHLDLINNILEMTPYFSGIDKEEFLKDFLLLFLFDIYQGLPLSPEEEIILDTKVEEGSSKAAYITRSVISLLKETVSSDYNYLRVFLPLLLDPVSIPGISAVIIARGGSLASDIANTVNKQCGAYIFDGLDINIESNVSGIIDSLRHYLSFTNSFGGLLILVDHDRPEELYEPVKNHLQGNLIAIGSISTNLALNLGKHLFEYRSFSALSEYAKESVALQAHFFENVSGGKHIIISCISGMGIAGKIADVISKQIGSNELKVITVDYKALMHMLEHGGINEFKDISLVITINDLESDKVPILPIHELQSSRGLALLKRLFGKNVDEDSIRAITRDIGLLFSIEGVAESLKILDPRKIVPDVGNCIDAYEMQYGITFSSSTRINLFLHISLMVERLLIGGNIGAEQAVGSKTVKQKEFMKNSQAILLPLMEKYGVLIDEREMEMIFEIVKYEILPGAFQKRNIKSN